MLRTYYSAHTFRLEEQQLAILIEPPTPEAESHALRVMAAIQSPQRDAPAPFPFAKAAQQHIAERLGMVVAASLLLWLALRLQSAGQLATHPVLGILSFLLYAAAFAALLYAALTVHVAKWLRSAFASLILAILLLSVAANVSAAILIENPAYGTDGLALSHLAAERLLSGGNPYSYRIEPSDLVRFAVPSYAITKTTFGATIHNAVSYPALGFLEFVPSLWVGVRDLRWTVLLVELVAIIVVALKTQAEWRTLVVAAIVANLDLSLYFTSGSLTDWMWVMPTLLSLLALYKRHFGLAAVMFGIAAATKQEPWFLAPFVAVWLYHNVQGGVWTRLRQTGNFALIALAVFLATNLPFIVASPGDWLGSVTAPLTEPMIPHGQGLSLLTQLGLLHVPTLFYTVIMLGVGALTFAAYAFYYEFAPAAAWALPAVVLWFSYRSFQNYFVYWIPILLLGLILEHRRQCTIVTS